MEKRFEGVERKYIKEDYLCRDDVLQYVLWKVLVGMDDYYELDEPEECRRILEEFKVANDPVRQFIDEVMRGLSVALRVSVLLVPPLVQ